MPARFVAQPYEDGDDLNEFLAEVAADQTLMRLQVAVAWAKRSGLSRVRSSLEAVRQRDGVVSVVLGIDEGVAALGANAK